jgi:hypothetical protein
MLTGKVSKAFDPSEARTDVFTPPTRQEGISTGMKIASRFFVAHPADITYEVSMTGPSDPSRVVAATEITLLEMALLLHVVQGGRLDGTEDLYALHTEFETVSGGGEDGPWLGKLPSLLAEALAVASDGDLEDYAVCWAEDGDLGSTDPAAHSSLLAGLRDLAQASRGRDQHLYLWAAVWQSQPGEPPAV